MKKILFVLLFFVATPAFATSGACSHHGGVDCSVVGVYATCYDGSQSSVFYTDMSECRSANSCIYPIAGGCTTQTDYGNLQAQAAIATNPAQYRGYGGDTSTQLAQVSEQYDQKLSVCQTQITQYQQALSAYNSCMTGGTSVPAIDQLAQEREECTASTPANSVATFNSSSENCSYSCKTGYQINSDRECVAIPPPVVQTPVVITTPTVVQTSSPTITSTLSSIAKPAVQSVATKTSVVSLPSPTISTTSTISAVAIKVSFWAWVAGFFRNLFAQ